MIMLKTKLRKTLNIISVYFLFPIGRFFCKVSKIIAGQKIKVSAAFIGTLITIISFYYSYFIIPDTDYFSQVNDALILERIYASYVMDICDTLEKTKDENLKKWLYTELISYYHEWARLFANSISLTDNHYRQGPEIQRLIKQFMKWNDAQIGYIRKHKSCPTNRYTTSELKEWQESIINTFPSSFQQFNRFYYRKYLLGK